MATPEDLRSAFENRMRQGLPNPPGEFDPQDLELIKDDKYLNKVLDHQDRDLKKASNMLWEIMTFRKTVGANQINESNIRLDYLKEGVFFPRGRDKDGGVLLIIKNKLYVKGQKDFNDIKRILVYWLERIDREENSEGKITLFFDMEGCSMGNVDMELIKFLISLFETYYPNFMNYIVIYQMPWILSAVFKVVKALLPAKGIDILKLVNKDNLKTIVPLDQALTCWGGSDPYVFEFIPENTDNRKVTFADEDDTHSPGEMLRLNPNDVVTFKNVNDELTGQFTITNMDDNAVSFKIRTTSPDKFRVRPSSGVLPSGSVQTVQILVQPGYQQNTAKDRFLVMSIELPKADLTSTELAEIWQNSSDSKVDEYRLKCQFPQKEISNGHIANGGKQISGINSFNNLQSNYDSLNRDIARLQNYQFLTLFFASVALFLTYLIYSNMDSEGRCEHMYNSVDF